VHPTIALKYKAGQSSVDHKLRVEILEMKAVVSQDIIVHITERGDTEIGKLPKGIGLERLRWDGSKVVDLAGLDEIWVECKNGAFILHAIEVPGSQLVRMTYKDRKRLTIEDGKIRLLTTGEIAEKQAEEKGKATDLRNLKHDFGQMIKNMDYSKVDKHIDNAFFNLTMAQKASLKWLYKTVLYLARRA